MAPAKVLQGAVRLHGLASSPAPDTHVRVAWACAVLAPSIGTAIKPMTASSNEVLIVSSILRLDLPNCVGSTRPQAHAEPTFIPVRRELAPGRSSPGHYARFNFKFMSSQI